MTQREILIKRLRLGVIIFFVAILLGYGAIEARNLAMGPVISITEPFDGYVATTSLVTIIGNAKNVSFITLDGGQIFTDENGNFSEDRILSSGYNVITIVAKDKFGKETEKTLHIIYKS